MSKNEKLKQNQLQIYGTLDQFVSPAIEKFSFKQKKVVENERKPLETNERLVILLIIAHILIFISMIIINFILGIINEILKSIIRLMVNINKLVSTFKEALN